VTLQQEIFYSVLKSPIVNYTCISLYSKLHSHFGHQSFFITN